jgi:hypothetical protein
MIEIKDLLDRWNTALFSEERKKETLARVLGEAIGVSLNTNDVKIQNGTVFLNIKPIYKNEIFLKKDKILSKMEESFGKTSPKNIL